MHAEINPQHGRWQPGEIVHPAPPENLGRAGVVWHYTSADGLLGILRQKEFWASSARRLNDSSEVEYGEHILKRAATSGLRPAPPVLELLNFDYVGYMKSRAFILSASRAGDAVSQWMHYAGQDGFSIGLDIGRGWTFRTPSGAHTENRRQEQEVEGSVTSSWRKVLYDQDAQVAAMRELVVRRMAIAGPSTEDALEIGRALIANEMRYMKYEGFKPESEYRMVLTLGDDILPAYRAIRGRIVPYVALTSAGWEAGRAPIIEVICSPGSTDSTLQIVRDLLRSHGVRDVPVTRSNAPLRN